DMPLVGFSESKVEAESFTGQVFMQLDHGAKGIPMPDDSAHAGEREFITGGRFRVVGFGEWHDDASMSENGKAPLVVKLEQVDTFDPHAVSKMTAADFQPWKFDHRVSDHTGGPEPVVGGEAEI